MKKIIIMGGGTFNHVRNHLAIAVPAFGGTARRLYEAFTDHMRVITQDQPVFDIELVLTKMADPQSKLVTNADVEAYVDRLIADPDVRAIVFNVAMADFTGTIEGEPSGPQAPRLKTAEGVHWMCMSPAQKVIGKIRKHRKDIFVVGFKTTTGASNEVQYRTGLHLLKANSLNLVLANDTVTRNNIVIAPEETRYYDGCDRDVALQTLMVMTYNRIQNTFTRSTVVEGEAVPWSSSDVPENLRAVVDYCIMEGAYKPVMGRTAGHFAVKLDDSRILTPIRKSNFNRLHDTGMVLVESEGPDKVIAHGHKPSVGGQSQRIIFSEHPDAECIVHFHSPKKMFSVDDIPRRSQWPNECGSHECGKNTSAGLREFDLGDGDKLKAVMLADHGPNIVFSRTTPAEKVITFIKNNFNLDQKTGGMVS